MLFILSTTRSSKLYPVQWELETYNLHFLNPLPGNFSLEPTMKASVQDLDGRRNLQAVTLRGHLKATAEAFGCQR